MRTARRPYRNAKTDKGRTRNHHKSYHVEKLIAGFYQIFPTCENNLIPWLDLAVVIQAGNQKRQNNITSKKVIWIGVIEQSVCLHCAVIHLVPR